MPYYLLELGGGGSWNGLVALDFFAGACTDTEESECRRACGLTPTTAPALALCLDGAQAPPPPPCVTFRLVVVSLRALDSHPPPSGLLRGELRGKGEHFPTRQHKEKQVSVSCL